MAVGRVRVTAEGRNTILQTTKALRLLFDGDAHVLISIPSPFRGRVCGLCGNFNGNWTDDFVLPSGTEAPSVDAFGAAWRAPSSSQGCGEGCGASGCPVCSAEETAPYESNQACGQIQDPQGPFADCHAVLNPSEYFRQCVYDLCFHKGSTTFLCSSLAAYTAACQAVGGTVKSWRTDSFCRECPGGPLRRLQTGLRDTPLTCSCPVCISGAVPPSGSLPSLSHSTPCWPPSCPLTGPSQTPFRGLLSGTRRRSSSSGLILNPFCGDPGGLVRQVRSSHDKACLWLTWPPKMGPYPLRSLAQDCISQVPTVRAMFPSNSQSRAMSRSFSQGQHLCPEPLSTPMALDLSSVLTVDTVCLQPRPFS